MPWPDGESGHKYTNLKQGDSVPQQTSVSTGSRASLPHPQFTKFKRMPTRQNSSQQSCSWGPMGWHRARAISRLQARWRGKHQGLFRQREEVRVTLVLAPWDPEPTLPLFLGRLWAWPGGFWETPHPEDFSAALLGKCLPFPLQMAPRIWGFLSLCARAVQRGTLPQAPSDCP